MFPLISTAWVVMTLLALSACSKQDGKATLCAWVLLGIFPPVFYKLMAL
jgi:hypothetical protein